MKVLTPKLKLGCLDLGGRDYINEEKEDQHSSYKRWVCEDFIKQYFVVDPRNSIWLEISDKETKESIKITLLRIYGGFIWGEQSSPEENEQNLMWRALDEFLLKSYVSKLKLPLYSGRKIDIFVRVLFQEA